MTNFLIITHETELKSKSGSMAAPAVNSKLSIAELLCRSGQRLHQAALAARGIILVNNALFSGLIQAADGLDNGSLVGLAGFDSGAGITNSGAGSATESAVTQTALLVLTIALDLRLDISQGISSVK